MKEEDKIKLLKLSEEDKKKKIKKDNDLKREQREKLNMKKQMKFWIKSEMNLKNWRTNVRY